MTTSRAWGVAVLVAALAAACGGEKNPTAPSVPAATLSAPILDLPGLDEQQDSLRPTLSVRNATADRPGARTYEFQIADNNTFTAATTSLVSGYAATIGKTGVPEGADGKTTWMPDQDLQPATRFYWRVRAVQDASNSPWSATGRFKSRIVGYSRPGELYDPLLDGETIGEIVGAATFIPGRGLQLGSAGSAVRYLLPQTVVNGEFSADIEGLRPNAPGDNASVFAMQEGDDGGAGRYRMDVQYRGAGATPPNAIAWRIAYGPANDPDAHYESLPARRLASVLLLNPTSAYHWKATWGAAYRLTVHEAGMDATPLYDDSLPTPRGAYTPSPQYAYLGAAVGAPGTESSSIPGAIYRNVWIANHPRPASLGTALVNP